MTRTLLSLLWFAAGATAAPWDRAPCWIEDAGAAGRHVWLLCNQERAFVSADGGETWRESRLPASAKLRAVEVLDAERVLVAGDEAVLLSSANGGESWSRVAVPTTEPLTDIHFSGESGWISGERGTILHSKDGGRTWQAQVTGVLVTLDAIFFADQQHGWAVGWNGTILRTVNGGGVWESVRAPEARWSLRSVYFRDPQNGWVTGMFGQLLRTRDGGVTWEAQASPLRSSLTSVLVDGAGRGWITAEDSVLESEDGGESWRARSVGDREFLERVVTAGDRILAVGPFGVLRHDAAKGGWVRLETLRPMAGATRLPEGPAVGRGWKLKVEPKRDLQLA